MLKKENKKISLNIIFAFLFFIITCGLILQPNISSAAAHLKEVTPQQKTYVDKKEIMLGTLSAMKYIKGGRYEMGPKNSKFDLVGDNVPVHSVTLSSFYFPKYLVNGTDYNSYAKMMGDKKQIKYDTTMDAVNNYPVQVNWYQANAYCAWLKDETGLPFSLPTEAQWEYVARDEGKRIAYAAQGGLLELGINFPNRKQHIIDNQGLVAGVPLPVDALPVNGLGIYQMSGNTNQWMKDWYQPDYYRKSPELNPQGPEQGFQNSKVLRGLDFFSINPESTIWVAEASNYTRIYDWPTHANAGFRCVINSQKSILELQAITIATQSQKEIIKLSKKNKKSKAQSSCYLPVCSRSRFETTYSIAKILSDPE